MRVLVCDDHALFREGLRLLLEGMDASMQVTLTRSAEEGVQLRAHSTFDLVLMDWHLDGLSGAQALAALREAFPRAQLVVLSGEKNASLIRSVIDLGAVGFIPKDISPEMLATALQTIAGGGIYLPGTVLTSIGSADRPSTTTPLREVVHAFPRLTQRQAEVLCATLRGLPNKLIARELGISDGTVKAHLSVVFRELGVQTRTEAVYVAAKHGVRIS